MPPSARAVVGEFAGLRTQSLRIPDGLGSRFDLELLVVPTPTAPEAVFRYAADRFDSRYVKDLVNTYQQIAACVAGHDDPS